ncbi:MAG: FAD-dependent monooxygenase [Deltaproteobacteria bacterium]|nr:FAD-dependent monooxygenase [Deltaproteobacteria bacterium]
MFPAILSSRPVALPRASRAAARPTRVAVLGGGVAACAVAHALAIDGWRVELFERAANRPAEGHGFVLLDRGVRALAQLGLGAALRTRGQPLARFEVRSPAGALRLSAAVDGAMGLRRRELLGALEPLPDPGALHVGRSFVEFEWHADGIARAARFADGSRVEADVFVAADGAGSVARRALFPWAALAPARVCEVVGQLEDPVLAADLGDRVCKFQRDDVGLAFGLVPAGCGGVIWYLQFDAERLPLPSRAPAAIAAFVHACVGDWCDPIPRALARIDFGRAYLASPIDLDPLPTLGRGNIALVGDAAHPFLPFSSQGVSAALDDAWTLAACLREHATARSWDAAITAYSDCQRPEIARIVAAGRDLQARFLDPRGAGREFVVPVCA